jgi:hypothetical protein
MMLSSVPEGLTGGEHYGIPFHVIFDSNARMLINSESPMGNIGYPSGFEGKTHLRRMLMETRSKLTVKQKAATVSRVKVNPKKPERYGPAQPVATSTPLCPVRRGNRSSIGVG